MCTGDTVTSDPASSTHFFHKSVFRTMPLHFAQSNDSSLMFTFFYFHLLMQFQLSENHKWIKMNDTTLNFLFSATNKLMIM